MGAYRQKQGGKDIFAYDSNRDNMSGSCLYGHDMICADFFAWGVAGVFGFSYFCGYEED